MRSLCDSSHALQLIEACNVIVYLRANVFLLTEPKIVSDREKYIDGLLLYKTTWSYEPNRPSMGFI